MAQSFVPGFQPLALAMLDNLADTVILTTEAGEFQFISASIQALLGYSVQQVEQMGNIRHLLGSGLFSLEELAQQGELRNLPVETVDQAGQLRHLIMHVKRLTGEEHPVPVLCYTCFDQTEQVQAIAQIHQQQRQFTMLLSALSDAVLIVNHQGHCVEANPAASQLLGYSRAYLLGCCLSDLLESGSTPVTLPWLFQQDNPEPNLSARGRNGVLLPVTCTLLPDYRPQHHLLVLRENRDRSYRVDSQEQLQQLNQLLEVRVQQRTHELQQAHQQESLIRKMTERIRQSLQLEDILNTTVAEVKEFFNCDRVLAYCLDPAVGGRVVAEAVGKDWQSVLGREINDCYFNDIYAELYRQGRVHAVTDIYAAQLTPCHVELLARLQVRANLAVPIVADEKLWGLLVVQQCRSVREWQRLEIQLLQQLATQVAIAIHQSELYRQVQVELTERQRAEARLQEQEQFLRCIYDNIQEGIFVLDVLADGTIQYAGLNPVYEQLFAISTDVIQGQKPEEVLSPALARSIQERCQRCLRSGNTIISEEMIPFQEQSLWWLTSLAPLHNADGYIDRIIGTSTNITELKQAEAELRQQAAWEQMLNAQLERRVKARTAELELAYEFEAMLKRITDKVRQSLDEDQIIQTAVQELAQAIGTHGCNASLYNLSERVAHVRYEHTTLSGSYLGRTLPMQNAPEIYEQLLQGQASQFCSLMPNSDRGRVALLAYPIMDNQTVLGDLWLVSRSGHAFTEHDIQLVQQVANQCGIALRQANLYRAAQAQVVELERLNRLKDDFLSTVSHELRTPMANIRMATEMLEMQLQGLLRCQQFHQGVEKPGCDRIPSYISMLKIECQRESQLIDDLLDLCRLDAEVEPLSMIEIKPEIWLRHIAEPFEERIRQQQQQLCFEIPAALPSIVTDLYYLERIISELLNNACKYTPPGETVTIAAQTSLDQTTLNIQIKNTGVSIPPAEQARIFEKFYRIPNSDPWKYGGTGLGLALVKKLVATLNGTIQVTSQSTETCFLIKLPLHTRSTSSVTDSVTDVAPHP
ncbi:MAG: GAF domain-containing protein [Thainema sp.]